MAVREHLRELGGVASYGTLERLTSRAEIDRAIAAGDVVRVARGRYALPEVDEAVAAAHRHRGVLSHASAALAWGWSLKALPERPHVTVPRRRPRIDDRHVELHRRDLRPDEVSEGRTSRELTLEQCLRSMPFDAALAVADSALREGFPVESLRTVAREARGPGAPRIRAVAAAADGSAANPFESVLRAIALGVSGLSVRPQVRVDQYRPDLVDTDLRIVLEADSFTWHGGRAALRRDAHRYNELVVADWIVLRFAREDVMFKPGGVVRTLDAAVALARGRTQVVVGRPG